MEFFTEKNINYADLVVAFIHCPFDEPEDDCPFKSYWEIPQIEDRIRAMAELPETELNRLREYHRQCILRQAERLKNAQSDSL